SLLHGALGFALVSVAAFSIWAFLPGLFRGFGGELGLYAAIAAVFLGLSGLILGPLAGGMGRFYSAFLPAFLVYSVIWTLAWFLLKGRLGEWVGAALGCAAFSYLALARLKAPSGWLTATLELFLLHTAGYFVGSWVMYS